MTTEELKAILQTWNEDAKEAINDDGVEISAGGIITSHPEIENRAGLALTGMTIAEALEELEEPDDGQKSLYFRGRG